MANEIQDYVTAVDASYNTIDEAVSSLEVSYTGIADDVAYLKESLSNPNISEADKALLAGALSRLNSLATRLNSVKDALTTLDEATKRPEPPQP